MGENEEELEKMEALYKSTASALHVSTQENARLQKRVSFLEHHAAGQSLSQFATAPEHSADDDLVGGGTQNEGGDFEEVSMWMSHRYI